MSDITISKDYFEQLLAVVLASKPFLNDWDNIDKWEELDNALKALEEGV